MTTVLSTLLPVPALALPCPATLGVLNVPILTFLLVAMVGGLIFAVIVVVAALFFKHRNQQLWHETARLALEKGQPLPPWPKRDEELELTPPPGASLAEWEAMRRARSQRGSFKAGLILVAVGIGLSISMGRQGGGLSGAIPALIGVALIVSALIEKLSAGGRRL